MSNGTEFGKELRQMRRSHANVVSLADIADVLECSVTYISAIERGERNPPSNDKIKKVLKYLGCEDKYDHMVGLAIKARKAVEIPIDGTNPKWTNILLGLARRSEEGMRENDPLIAKLNELLEKDDEEEKRCRPLFHESPQSQSAKSKRKRPNS